MVAGGKIESELKTLGGGVENAVVTGVGACCTGLSRGRPVQQVGAGRSGGGKGGGLENTGGGLLTFFGLTDRGLLTFFEVTSRVCLHRSARRRTLVSVRRKQSS